VPNESGENPNILGSFIRAQRELANLSLRQLSAMTAVSNPYLSQIERGMSEPSIRILKSIAEALDISAEALYEQAGLSSKRECAEEAATELAIRCDGRLTQPQRNALLAVYRTYLEAHGHE
jgi:transcriptional regulator with XRE-family HTH domain